MEHRHLPSVKSEPSLGISNLKRYTDGWFLACEIRPCSPATLASRRIYIRNLFWFLNHHEYDSCGVMEMRAFFAYLGRDFKSGGRWGRANETGKVKPGTLATYHRNLRALFAWIVSEGGMEASPMARIPVPIDRPDAIDPFTDEQVNSLLSAAKKTVNPHRDEAIIWFLLDTGVRASELCAIRFEDLDLTMRRCNITEGKGGKARPVYVGKACAKALWAYLRDDGREQGQSLFESSRGEALTRSGLLAIIRRLGKSAKVAQVRCSPHTFRHTFAISFLRNGGNQMSLCTILGHTDLKATSRYVKIAEADVAVQSRQFSPGDRLKKGK